MTDYKVSNYLIGIVLFSFIIVGGVSLMGMFRAENTDFGGDHYTEFNQSFNVMSDISTEVTDLQTGIESTEDQDFGTFGVLNALISKSWQSLRLFVSSFSFMNSAFAGASTIFGVPAWIPTLAGLIVAIVIIFSILSAIFQRSL